MTSKSDNLRYSIIPARAITDPNITAQALRVLALLGKHAADNGWCRRSQVRMAKELACSRGTIQNALDLLIGQENGTGYVERREESRPNVSPVEGRHPHCAYSYRVRLDLDDDDRAEGASRLARGRASQKARGATPDQHPVPIPLAPLTEHTPWEHSPHEQDGREEIASLGKGKPDRWPEFRSTVANSWLNGFPADNEVACKAEFERQTRGHPPEQIIACAGLHGAELRKRQAARGKGAGAILVKRPSNWLKDGDWQGYIPAAAQAVEQEAKITTALGRVQRALGSGVFDLLRRQGMPDGALAMLDGMTLDAPAEFTASSYQRSLIERHVAALERHLGARPDFRSARREAG